MRRFVWMIGASMVLGCAPERSACGGGLGEEAGIQPDAPDGVVDPGPRDLVENSGDRAEVSADVPGDTPDPGSEGAARDSSGDVLAPDCPPISPPARLPPLHAEGGFIRDPSGRIVLLRGVNLSGAEWGDRNAFTEADLDALQVFGFNAVRLPFGWTGVEPDPGVINEAYLDFLDSMLAWAEAREIYVLLDAHQWYWSLVGMPEWTCPLPPAMDQEYLLECAGVFFGSEDLMARFATMWARIARRYRGHPAVVAFDLFNEPPPPSLGALFDGTFEGQTLPAFYSRVVEAIRAEDPDRMVFVESAVVSLGNTALPPLPFGNAVYSPHIYIPHTYEVGVGLVWLIEPSPDFVQAQYDIASGDAARLGMPMVVGEYGVAPDKEGAAGWLLTSAALQDRLHAGSFYWDYRGGWGLFDADRTPRPFYLEHLLRPFLAVTAGEVIEVQAEPWSGFFRSRIRVTPDQVCGVTEVVLPTALYPTGPKVSVSDNARYLLDVPRQRLYVQGLVPDGTVEVMVQ